ncbi:Sperm-associated antigen 6 [Chytriomyces hyalinus]|nr:Sperm-associated antigen 6 [Chytriomyces hyalinus]
MKESSNAKVVLGVFETYQKQRLLFAQTVADLASRESNMDALHGAGVCQVSCFLLHQGKVLNWLSQLLRPLLLDRVPAIQHAAALALGRIANYNEELAEAVVDSDIVPHLVYSLAEQNRFYKKAAAFVLRAVAKHSPELAQAVVDAGALNALVTCLEEFDPGVKESAAWALGYIARHSPDLAQAVVDAGAVPLLVLCVQEPELSLRRIAASALSDISKHSPELAQSVVDANTIPFIAPLLANPDAKLRRQVCSALSQISKHTVHLAETVVDGELFPNVLNCLKDPDGYVRKNSATLICEIAKHTPELAQLVVNSGGLAAMVDYTSDARGNARLPGIMTLGYIAAFSETLACAVLLAKAAAPLSHALVHEPEEHVKAASAWSLGQIGRHGPDHAKALAEMGVLAKLLKVLTGSGSGGPSGPSAAGGDEEGGSDLKMKAKRALKCILEKTLLLDALEPLLQPSTPVNVLKYVVGQFAKILPNDVAARRAFVTSGGLQRVQEIAAGLGNASGGAGGSGLLNGTKMGEYIRTINECYPEEIVRYYSPGYSATLLEKIDEYSRIHDQAAKLAASESVAPQQPAVTPSILA